MTQRKKLIEVALPLDAINKEAAREKSIRHGHPSTLHLWWARRPLAACRAVLFSQLVDDPSSWPEIYPTEKEQRQEREELFGIIEQLVKWENSNNADVLNRAKLKIAQSIARGRIIDNGSTPQDKAVLSASVSAESINQYLAETMPIIYDPFAGGGSIPLEAQRLGLRSHGSDINPVAVIINKALLEIPPKFRNCLPVNPKCIQQRIGGWSGAQGLAEDIKYYGEWVRQKAFDSIGHYYPTVKLPKENGGGAATVIAWLWARTVASPDPTQQGRHVPLISSFFYRLKKEGKFG